MILGAILLILIGSADIVRSALRGRPRRVSVWLCAAIWAGVVLLAVTGLGVAIWWIAIPVVLAVLWLGSTSASLDARSPAGIVPAVGILAALVAAVVWDRTADGARGFIVDWHASAPLSVIGDVPLPALVMGVGVAVFLVESSNIIVRAALRPTRDEPGPQPVETPRRRGWWRKAEIPVGAVTDLKGGRLIGPLERVLIVTLTLAGSYPVVAGLLAAKGIVRFPEISADGTGGSKAEYFLVGSLVSWTVALGATGLLWIAAQG